MTATLSLRGLAKLLRVSPRAVRNGLARGVFTHGSVRRDATNYPNVVDATLAVAEWQKSGRSCGPAYRPAPAPAPPVQTSALPTREVFEAFNDQFTILRHGDDCAICLSFVRGSRELVFLLRPPVHAFLLGERLKVAATDTAEYFGNIDEEANA